MRGKHVLLVVGGGVAAYKSLELVRRLADGGISTRCVMTKAAQEFVTPLAFASLTGEVVHTELFELTSEVEMGHIELSRSADLILVAPATADLLAKMANGLANDLASTILLATDKTVFVAPAMNVRMWEHPATQRNVATLASDQVRIIGPNQGAMACGEFGYGRMAEPDQLVQEVEAFFQRDSRAPSLAGLRVLVTSGPTHEPIDPVRYIANRSSGRQGSAIGSALTAAGAEVTFVTGPAEAPPPQAKHVIAIQTAREMRDAVMAALPVDVAIFAAAVADWRVQSEQAGKIKKTPGAAAVPQLELVENPDILAEVSQLPAQTRPKLVIGFAAETDDVLANARAKLERKRCDWLLANDVSPETGIMGGEQNQATLLTGQGKESWPRLGKDEVASRLVAKIAEWRAVHSGQGGIE